MGAAGEFCIEFCTYMYCFITIIQAVVHWFHSLCFVAVGCWNLLQEYPAWENLLHKFTTQKFALQIIVRVKNNYIIMVLFVRKLIDASMFLIICLTMCLWPATCINNWPVWHTIRGWLLLLLHPMSSRLPNTATSCAANVYWWRSCSIQPKLIQERQSVSQHSGVNILFVCFIGRLSF